MADEHFLDLTRRTLDLSPHCSRPLLLCYALEALHGCGDRSAAHRALFLVDADRLARLRDLKEAIRTGVSARHWKDALPLLAAVAPTVSKNVLQPAAAALGHEDERLVGQVFTAHLPDAVWQEAWHGSTQEFGPLDDRALAVRAAPLDTALLDEVQRALIRH